jgi:hypothetical protein
MKKILFAALALAMALPLSASAQSSLDSSQAQSYLGTWAISFESPQGEFIMDLALTDASGKVAATISNDMMGTQDIDDISLSGENLVLRYEIDAQGQLAPVALTLVPADDGVNATMDFADGMFVMDGIGAKKM